jgi:polar amino acid transport system substrate-binding protein
MSPSAFDIGKILAPRGTLHVGLFPGSPLSLVQLAKTGETHGISFDLGTELARRLDLPLEQKIYGRVAEVLDAMKSGSVDFTVTNATPIRAQDVAFSQTLLSLELGYLVPANSPSSTPRISRKLACVLA